jgi:cation:H+ antiporter
VQAAIAESALSRTSLPLNVLRVLIAALTLYWGARLVVGAAADFGAALGWTPLLVGLLPVAIGTALPEVAAAIAAARRGHGDMVLGHVLGSSVVNLLLVIGAMACCSRWRCRPRSCAWNCRRCWRSRWCCTRCCVAT